MVGRHSFEGDLQKLYVGLVVVLEGRSFDGKWARLSQIPRKWREEVGLLPGLACAERYRCPRARAIVVREKFFLTFSTSGGYPLLRY